MRGKRYVPYVPKWRLAQSRRAWRAAEKAHAEALANCKHEAVYVAYMPAEDIDGLATEAGTVIRCANCKLLLGEHHED